MKTFKILLILTLIISCKNQSKKKDLAKPDLSEQNEGLDLENLNKAKVSIKYFITKDWLKDSGAYQPISWSKLEIINGLDFKYKVAHQFKGMSKFYTKTKVIDSLVIYDMTFNISDQYKVISATKTDEYSEHYDKQGLPYQMFSNKELQKIGLKYGFDMILYKNNKNKLSFVGGGIEFPETIGISKEKWSSENSIKISPELIKMTDTIEYCTDLIGGDCIQFVFKEGKLNEIKNIP
ncbi:hypothetical protein [uncultured Aquimarina sp.]|uniref:hypothetical protein n=1 Tax=uncultured Aquimarina sp. TaxID=575652 RepID=UPI00262A7FFC|nr:hypothetical protein [uncultured Aquimarina sp.]